MMSPVVPFICLTISVNSATKSEIVTLKLLYIWVPNSQCGRAVLHVNNIIYLLFNILLILHLGTYLNMYILLSSANWYS